VQVRKTLRYIVNLKLLYIRSLVLRSVTILAGILMSFRVDSHAKVSPNKYFPQTCPPPTTELPNGIGYDNNRFSPFARKSHWSISELCGPGHAVFVAWQGRTPQFRPAFHLHLRTSNLRAWGSSILATATRPSRIRVRVW